MTRGTGSAIGGAATLVLCAALAQGQPPAVVFAPVAAGFASPVGVTGSGDGSGRLFVIEQPGRIRVFTPGQTPTLFLDIASRVTCCGERGLLGLAFPPGYADKGHFYVNYTDIAGDSVVARYHRTADPDVADPGSEQVVMRVDQPYSNHNAGHLAFGPDGYLYIGWGDGGSGGDPYNYAQNPAELLGKMLRIDVESGVLPYGVPADNPFVGMTGWRPEIWALGLRNPWRYSFDRSTGDLWIADVGQNSWEEIDFQLATSAGGENYGWRIMESAHCYSPNPCNSVGLVLPAAEYSHSVGCSVTGGYVSRAADYPSLIGWYVYGDYCSGRLWALRPIPGGWDNQLVADTAFNISSFGEDDASRTYLVHHGGAIYRLQDGAVDPVADLAVSITDAGKPVPINGTEQATITVSNAGAGSATGVVLDISLPPELALAGAVPGQGSCAPAPGGATCAVGVLAPAGSTTVALTATALAKGTATVDAAVAANEADADASDNTGALEVKVVPGKRVRQRLVGAGVLPVLP